MKVEQLGSRSLTLRLSAALQTLLKTDAILGFLGMVPQHDLEVPVSLLTCS